MKRFKNRAGVGLLVLGSLIPLTFAGSVIAASPPGIGLGTADSFAILAGSAITDVPASPITGDVGVSPAAGSFIGLTCGEVSGTIYSVDATGPLPCRVTNPGLLTQAKNDLTTAYGNAAGRTPDTTFVAADNQLGGQTLTGGVYRFGGAVTANLIGNLTLSGDASSVWIFQATSTLITAASSSVTLTGGAQACNVFWQVSTSATIATSTSFVGTIMADQQIALQTGATLQGRALARIAGVTLDHNTITKPSCSAVDATPADVGVVKTASPSSVSIGDNVTYTSVVTNHGPGVATAVAFDDALPAGGTFVSATTTQGSCTGTTTVTCAIGTLAVGASATVVLVVKTTAAGTITNTGRISARQADQNVGANNTSAAVVQVAALVVPPVAQPAPAPKPKPKPKPAAVKKATTVAGAATSVASPALPAANPAGFTG